MSLTVEDKLIEVPQVLPNLENSDGSGPVRQKGTPDGSSFTISASPPPSDQGADLSLSTTALSGGAGAQAIPAGTTHIRFVLKAVAGANNWANIKFGTSGVTVTSSTGTLLMAADEPLVVPVPNGATHFDAIAGAAITMNWTPT